LKGSESSEANLLKEIWRDADIKLMKAMSEDNSSNGSQMLCSAIIFGVPAVASIIAIIYFICSL
jgi:hypothetical protein